MTINERQHLAVLYAIIIHQGLPPNKDWPNIAACLPGDPNPSTVRSRFRRFQEFAKKQLLLEQVEAPEAEAAKKTPLNKTAGKKIASVSGNATKTAGKGKGRGKATTRSKGVVDESEDGSGNESEGENAEDDSAVGHSMRLFKTVEEEKHDGDETRVDGVSSSRSYPSSLSLPTSKRSEKVGRPKSSIGKWKSEPMTRSPMETANPADDDEEEEEDEEDEKMEEAKVAKVKKTFPLASANNGRGHKKVTGSVQAREEEEIVRPSSLKKATFKAINWEQSQSDGEEDEL